MSTITRSKRPIIIICCLFLIVDITAVAVTTTEGTNCGIGLLICNTNENLTSSDCCSLFLPEGNQNRSGQEVKYIGDGLGSCQNKSFVTGANSFQVSITRTAICCYGDIVNGDGKPCGTRDDPWIMNSIKFNASGVVYKCVNTPSTYINYVDYGLTPPCATSGRHNPMLNRSCVAAAGRQINLKQ